MLGVCALLAFANGCGSSASDAQGGAAGNAGTNAGAGSGGGGAGAGTPLFPQAPVCAGTDNLKFHGTLDGTPLLDDQSFAISNLDGYDIQAGEGPIINNGFAWVFEALVMNAWKKGEKQDTFVVNGLSSSYYVSSDHPLKGQYLCVTSGQIGALADAASGHVTFQWHLTGFNLTPTPISPMSPPGRDCSGRAVTGDIYGCLDRDTPYFP